ncbi:MAG: metallophosphoesterase [Xanthobacteraceae bacterium]
MFVLAHLSDLHLASPPGISDLAGKRGLGFINWQRKRKFIHRPDVLDAISRDVKAQAPDHIAVTGDLVNLSLPAEYAKAKRWLQALGNPSDVTVIPGNHDAYVRSAARSPAAFWGDYMRGDDGLERFPFIRRRGNIALIALSTGVPTGPFMATGRLGEKQLAGLADALEQTQGNFRVVLIHHPPMSPLRRFLRRLTDAAIFRSVLAEKGAELVLHGHDHRRSLIWLQGPDGKKIPAIGAPSASARARHGDEDPAGYHLFRIDRDAEAWRCKMIARERGVDGTISECGRQTIS